MRALGMSQNVVGFWITKKYEFPRLHGGEIAAIRQSRPSVAPEAIAREKATAA
jgi:hypothetical protein